MTIKFKLTALTGAILLLSASAASAVDFDGYLRAGPAATSKKNAARGCYKLNTPGMQYRLGNECDFYGEFGFAQNGTVGGVTYKGYVMINKYEPDSNGDQNSAKNNVAFEQMYVEAQGYDILPDAKFWAGKRFYGRYNVDMVDTFYSNLTGTGGGVYNIGAGPGKFGIAYFKSDLGINDNTLGTYSGVSGNRINIEYYDLPVNPGGKIRIVGTLTDANVDGNSVNANTAGFGGKDGKSGAGLTVLHFQENLFGLGKDTSNTFFAQYAQGSTDLNGSFGSATADSGRKAYRLVESLTWQVGPFGGQGQVMVQQDKYDVAQTITVNPSGSGQYTKKTSWTIGARGSYAVTNNFKLLLEAGYSEIHPDGQNTAKLGKITFAPALAVGPGYWNRPELRAYVTYGKWNTAAKNFDGSNAGTLNDDAFNDSRSGVSYGLQAEMWF